MFQPDKELVSNPNKTGVDYEMLANLLLQGAREVTPRRSYSYLYEDEDDGWCGCALGMIAKALGWSDALGDQREAFDYIVERVAVRKEVLFEIEARFEGWLYPRHSIPDVVEWLHGQSRG